MSAAVEREAKFRLPSWEEGERLLARVGATLESPRHFESNVLFDLEGTPLGRKGQALRLRRAGGESWLTFKGPVLGRSWLKERREVETAVGDADAVAEILGELGLSPRFRYDKYRAAYRLRDLIITLDETPIGHFVEIEGAPEEIERVAGEMGLAMEASITLSYPRLYQMHREGRPELPPDMMFETPDSLEVNGAPRHEPNIR